MTFQILCHTYQNYIRNLGMVRLEIPSNFVSIKTWIFFMLTTGHKIFLKCPCTYWSIHSLLGHDVLTLVTRAAEIYLSSNQKITPLTLLFAFNSWYIQKQSWSCFNSLQLFLIDFGFSTCIYTYTHICVCIAICINKDCIYHVINIYFPIHHPL